LRRLLLSGNSLRLDGGYLLVGGLGNKPLELCVDFTIVPVHGLFDHRRVKLHVVLYHLQAVSMDFLPLLLLMTPLNVVVLELLGGVDKEVDGLVVVQVVSR
jgi:hypothetical protein